MEPLGAVVFGVLLVIVILTFLSLITGGLKVRKNLGRKIMGKRGGKIRGRLGARLYNSVGRRRWRT